MDFAHIFDKSKLLEVRLHPLHPRLLHHCSGSHTAVPYKSSFGPRRNLSLRPLPYILKTLNVEFFG